VVVLIVPNCWSFPLTSTLWQYIMQRQHACFLFSILLVLSTCSSGFAQPLVQSFTSVEAMIASADFVALGSIESVKDKILVAAGTINGTSNPNDKYGYELTTKFEQIVKNVERDGEPEETNGRFKSFQIVAQDGQNADVSLLAENKTKGLWLIYPKEPTEKFHSWMFLPFDDERGVNHFGYRTRSLKPPAFASDFSILITHQQILERIKQYGPISQRQHRSNTMRVASVYVPRVVLGPIDTSGGTDYRVSLPIDSKLPSTARRLIESPAEFVSNKEAVDAGTLDTLRVAGIVLLGSMKTESSIQLLKNCLDPSVIPFTPNWGGAAGRVQHRVRAYQRLLDWRINPPRPAFASDVKQLSLPGTNINDDTLALVAEFENLERLTLWGTKITESGIQHLGKLKKLNLLELNDKQVTDKIVHTLAENGQLHVLSQAATTDRITRPGSTSKVTQLSFWFAPFADAGLKHFRQFKNLTNIDLGRMKITDAAIQHLSEFKKLKFATLRETSITKEGFARLRKALPDCQIETR